MDWVDAPGHIGEFSVDHAFVELDAAATRFRVTMELTAAQAQHAVDVAKATWPRRRSQKECS